VAILCESTENKLCVKIMGVSVYSGDVKIWHRLSSAVAFDSTSGSRCRVAAARIWQRSEETLLFADWLIQDGRLVRKFVILCRLIFIAVPN